MLPFIPRISRLVAALGLAGAGWLSLELAAAAPASAALPPVAGCGFTLGHIYGQGALGTSIYTLTLIPASPAEDCTTTVFATTSVVPNPAPGGPSAYSHIQNNPLIQTPTVSFTPGRLPPTVIVGWAGFGCADPPVPGTLSFQLGGVPGKASVPVDPESCSVAASPTSQLEAITVPGDSAVGMVGTPDGGGYQIVDQLANLTALGDAPRFSSPSAPSPVVALQRTPDGNGDWVVSANGGLAVIGDAVNFGSPAGTLTLAEPIVGMAATADGNGYWLVGADGGVFSYGDAVFYGSTGGIHLNDPIVGMAATPDGKGYWLVASDGGIFSFGDAAFSGSLGNLVLNAPIVGMAAHPGGGYWLVASDGGVFSFGGAPFEGSMGGTHLNAPVSAMATTPGGQGYWLLGSDGGVFAFGDAGFYGAGPNTTGLPLS